jgi:large subunit ribosomal protein L24
MAKKPATPVKLHVRKGDLVQVISGSDKGTVGEVLKALPKKGQVIVKGVNLRTKHMKPRQEGESGQIVTSEFPISSSKVLHYSEKQKVASRICHTVTDAGKKVRMLKKTGEVID